jgi:release factor glutamine methyltransferase
LGVTAKLEVPDAQVIAIDSSIEALGVARKNAEKHKVGIDFRHGSLLEPLRFDFNSQSFTIMANLPYVPKNMITSPEITHEPAAALFSGPDGMDHYRKFWKEVVALEIKPQYILSESLEDQHAEMAKLAEKASYKLQKTDVLVQLFHTI